jgi:Flp pilus assembly protein TadG
MARRLLSQNDEFDHSPVQDPDMRTFSTLRRFQRDERGAVGLIFGLSIIPLMGLTGVAVDYARATSVRAELQMAADATALALAKDAVKLDAGQTTIRAQAVFDGNWGKRFESELTSLTVTRETDRFKIQAKAHVKYSFLPVLGLNGIDVAVTSTSGWGVNKIEIALVLDNTGSMGWSGKMPELKKALCGNTTCSNTMPTSGFVRHMQDAAIDADQIRVALVPFDTTVRVPASVQASVLTSPNSPGTVSYGGAGYCGMAPVTAQRVSWLRFADRDKDTIASGWNASGVWVGSGCGVGRITKATWQGCLWDRDQTGNRDVTADGVNPASIETLYPAVTCRSNDLARMASLMDVKANGPQLITALAAMKPSGNTNLTIGINWGMNMLMPGQPMSNAIPAEPNLSRFMILLTDGDNTENRQGFFASAIDPRARLACTNAKAQGIVIYAVRVIEGNKSLLQDCSSGPGYYYEVATAAQIDDVFKAIAGRIGSIRLTN